VVQIIPTDTADVGDQAAIRTPPDMKATRWFTHQPNVTGEGIIASYGLRFWVLVLMIGAVSGAAAGALMQLLSLSEHLAYGYRTGSLLHGASAAPSWRRVAVLLAAAAIVIVGLSLLRRVPGSGASDVSDALWLRAGRVAVLPSVGRGVLSIITVGMGVSLGREAAPQVTGAAAASWLARRARLPTWQRRLLVAAGAGAGFAAVYNVPLGGALFAVEVLLGTLALPLVLPALAAALTATAVAWLMLGTHPAYHVPSYGMKASYIPWAAIIAPMIGLLSVGWSRLIALAAVSRPRRQARIAAPLIVFAGLGALSIPYPQLLGNGKDVVQLGLVGNLSLGTVVTLLALKPVVTVGCLGTGAPGGLFTPTLTVGVLFASATGLLWSHVWHGASPGGYALIGGAAFLAASMQAPLAGIVLSLELTRHLDALMVPTLLAVTEATIVARRFGAQSIYSARLRFDPEQAATATASAAAMLTLHALDDADLPHETTRSPSQA
jgi:chloride channel protein, CIC family